MEPIIEEEDQRLAMNYLRCLTKAMETVQEILSRENASANEIHQAKSVLYAAIERAGIRADRFLCIQRKLRELLSLVAMLGDAREHERLTGLQILEELRTRYGFDTLNRLE